MHSARVVSPEAPLPARPPACPHIATAIGGPPQAQSVPSGCLTHETRQSAPSAHWQPWPRAKSDRSHRQHKRSRFPVTHLFHHTVPWSSLDDAWSRNPLTPVNDTITLGDGHSISYPSADPLPHLDVVVSDLRPELETPGMR